MALVALSAMILPSIASAKAPPPPPTSQYLALGDSLAFGYSKQLYNEAESKGDPAQAFENGYVNKYYKKIGGAAAAIGLTNDGCPGETTESLIGNNPELIAGLNGALGTTGAGENKEVKGESPCLYKYIHDYTKENGKGGPLHNEYGAGGSTFELEGKPIIPKVASQLENVVTEIATDAAYGHPVKTLSLNIGANDSLAIIAKCEKKAGKEVEQEIGEGKLAYGEPEDKEAGEKHAKECISAEVPGLFSQINTNLAAILLAIRHGEALGGVNYTGKILLNSSYNPYGNLLAFNPPETEVLQGTNELNGLGNQIQKETGESFAVCYVQKIQTSFNPQNKSEPKLLQTLTNMTNTTEFEGKKNGPDIHPTPKGYAKIAQDMFKEIEHSEEEMENHTCQL